MFFVIWPSVLQVIAVICTAFIIKAMDDVIDQVRDEAIAAPNWALRVGPGLLVYAVVATVMAMMANSHWTVALISASYVVGMLGTLSEVLPSHLTSWQEIGLVMVGSLVYLHSTSLYVTAIALMMAIQLIDDMLDQVASIPWLTNRGERMFWSAFFILLAWYLQPSFTLIVLGVYGTFILSEFLSLRHSD